MFWTALQVECYFYFQTGKRSSDEDSSNSAKRSRDGSKENSPRHELSVGETLRLEEKKQMHKRAEKEAAKAAKAASKLKAQGKPPSNGKKKPHKGKTAEKLLESTLLPGTSQETADASPPDALDVDDGRPDGAASTSEEGNTTENDDFAEAPHQDGGDVAQTLLNMNNNIAAMFEEIKRLNTRVKENESKLNKRQKAPQLPTAPAPPATRGASSALQPTNDPEVPPETTQGLEALQLAHSNEEDAGECTLNYNSMSVDGLPHGRLSDSIKRKIWQDQYVDFSDLLEKQDSRYALKLNAEAGGSICLEQKAKTELSLADWKKAFGIFQSCYLSKFDAPEYSKQLMLQTMQDFIKYQLLIFKMAGENKDWLYYDKNFRKEREESKRRFSIRDNDLFLDAGLRFKSRDRLLLTDSSRADLGYGEKFRSQSELFVPKKWCFKYHKEHLSCTTPRCTWRHSCFLCDGAHPAFTCGKTPRQKGDQQRRHDRKVKHEAKLPPYPYKDYKAGSPPRKLQR